MYFWNDDNMFTKTTDPHAIYKKIHHVFTEYYKVDCTIINRPLSGLRTGWYFLDSIIVFFQDAIVCLRLYLNFNKKKLIVREFSGITLFFLFPLIYPLRKKVSFNINHNLNSKFERFFISIISFKIKFIFIGSGNLLKQMFPKFDHIPFLPRKMNFRSINRKLIIFTGSRAEQKIDNLEERINIITNVVKNRDIELLAVGLNAKKLKTKISQTDYLKNLELTIEGSGTILLYAPENYHFRHSGILWQLVEDAAMLVVPMTDVVEGTILHRKLPTYFFNPESMQDFKKTIELSVCCYD